MIDPNWVLKTKPLVDRDLIMRNILLERGVLNDTYHAEMEKIHIENARKLEKLIFKMGFPVLSNAGDEGVRLTWLIIHHAISLPNFMKESLQEMRMAAAQRDYVLELVAYTEDRVAYFEGREQIFGTNFDWQDGELKPTPIADPSMVDARRKGYGLPPMAISFLGAIAERPPSDPEKKNKEFIEWLKRVGWRS